MTEDQQNYDQAAELQPPVVQDAPAAAEDAPAAAGVTTPELGTEDADTPAGVVAPTSSPAGGVDQADDEDDDPSAGMAGVDVTQPNPYAGPLGYVGKFATDAKAITDSEAPDELDAGAGDQLDVAPADQLDQQPPA